MSKSGYNALKLANEPLFCQMSEFDCVYEFYEVQMFKKVHNHTIHIYLCMLCLQLSKQCVLNLYYNFISKYIKWEDWNPVPMAKWKKLIINIDGFVEHAVKM